MPYKPEQECPLDGVRVLDLSRLVAGNMLSLQLADFGAEVVKIEPHRGDPLRHWTDEGVSPYWKVYGRNKKSIRLDLKSNDGKDLFRKLLATAHVVIESFRPGVMEALGFGPEEVLGINPKIVMARVSGWGQTGPYKRKPGFGSLMEAMSGFAAKNGFADKPPALPNMALADMVAGLSGAFAVMVALREAEKPQGKGQSIDVSLLEPLHSILGPDAAQYRITGNVLPRSGNRASITAPRNVYQSSDGKWVALTGSTQVMAQRLFKAIGRTDMINDPKFVDNSARLDHVDELDTIIQSFIGQRTLLENLTFFEKEQVTVGPVYDSPDFETDAHVKARGIMVEVPDNDLGSIPMHDVVPRLSRTPGAIRRKAPDLGDDEFEILGPLCG